MKLIELDRYLPMTKISHHLQYIGKDDLLRRAQSRCTWRELSKIDIPTTIKKRR